MRKTQSDLETAAAAMPAAWYLAYLELPVSVGGQHYRGSFMHRPGDDDSSAVTFWGKRDLRDVLRKALRMLDEHYGQES